MQARLREALRTKSTPLGSGVSQPLFGAVDELLKCADVYCEAMGGECDEAARELQSPLPSFSADATPCDASNASAACNKPTPPVAPCLANCSTLAKAVGVASTAHHAACDCLLTPSAKATEAAQRAAALVHLAAQGVRCHSAFCSAASVMGCSSTPRPRWQQSLTPQLLQLSEGSEAPKSQLWQGLLSAAQLVAQHMAQPVPNSAPQPQVQPEQQLVWNGLWSTAKRMAQRMAWAVRAERSVRAARAVRVAWAPRAARPLQAAQETAAQETAAQETAAHHRPSTRCHPRQTDPPCGTATGRRRSSSSVFPVCLQRWRRGRTPNPRRV